MLLPNYSTDSVYNYQEEEEEEEELSREIKSTICVQ
jgi:hypothetical protein